MSQEYISQADQLTEVSTSITHTPEDMLKHYQQGTILYEEGLKHYSLRINKLKSEIDTLEKGSQNDEHLLLSLATEIYHEDKLLERFHADFSQKIDSIDALKNEYKNLLESTIYDKLYKGKKSALLETIDEIEEHEYRLLTQELEHLNVLAKVEPIRQKITRLKVDLQALILEKEYFATSKLQHISQLNIRYHKNDIIDTETTTALTL